MTSTWHCQIFGGDESVSEESQGDGDSWLSNEIVANSHTKQKHLMAGHQDHHSPTKKISFDWGCCNRRRAESSCRRSTLGCMWDAHHYAASDEPNAGHSHPTITTWSCDTAQMKYLSTPCLIRWWYLLFLPADWQLPLVRFAKYWMPFIIHYILVHGQQNNILQIIGLHYVTPSMEDTDRIRVTNRKAS